MRKWLPWAGALLVLVALWPTVCSSSEAGPTKCESFLLPLPWSDNDAWFIVAVAAVAIVLLLLRTLLRPRTDGDA